MRASLFLIPLLLSSAACTPVDDYAEQAGVGSGASAQASANAIASGANGKARSVAEANDTYEFEYSYPAQAGAYPALREHLDADLERIKASLMEDAQKWKVEAEREGFPFHPYSASTEWKVVADLPGWLSLSADSSTYTGGAHGMYGTRGLVFNKRARAIRQPIELFRSPAALQGAVEDRWCAALDKEREARRGEPVDKRDEFFGDCPGIEELTVLLGSSNGETFDRIGLIAGPYVAGSYAEGDYEVTLAVDDAVLEAVKPEYRGTFGIKR